MDVLVQQMKEQGLKDIETLLKNQVAVAFEPAIDAMSAKLKAAIPGAIDDAVIEMIVVALKPILKEELLKQIEKVSV